VKNHHSLEAVGVPTVSVITLNWNGLVHLRTCYESLRELNYPRDRLELMLVDNGSTDGSVEFMQQCFPEVKVIKNDANLGFCKGNNLGVQAAQGEYVAFLNNDTRVHVDWLRELVAAVEVAPDVVCAGSKILTWEGDRLDFAGGSVNFHGGGYQPGYGSPDVDPFSENREVLFACGGSMLIDRRIFLDCGGFDEDFFAVFEDLDLGWRLWLLGHKVVLVPTAVTYHRFHGTSRHLPYEKLVALKERNALLSVMKNYSDENLAQVLPAALFLMMERAFLSSKTDSSSYKLDGLRHEGENYLSVLGPASKDGNRGGRKSVQEMIHREGLRRVAHRAVRKAWRILCRWLVVHFNSELEAVPRTSISGLVAADDVIRLLPRVMRRRREIQQKRTRSDAEICYLFGDPFRPELESVQYRRIQDQLVRLFGIQDIFAW
jgi:GT2 family glycosyltransferase